MKRIILLLLTLSLWAHSATTVRIAVLRVQFQEDNNSLTTGNGRFMIDTVTTRPFAIDPAPHNRTYFNDQIIAADNYFNAVSSGQVRIKGTIFPRGLNAAYTLPNEMAFYNPNTSNAAIDEGVARLFRDAILLADEDSALTFADYDLVMIFHAGVGRDVDLGFDETPQDIPSLFLTPKFLKDNLGADFNGISVDDGRFTVTRGVLLPETQNQAGYDLALTGFVVSNIGSYLGMKDLVSVREGRSGVGRFGLMDVGLLNAAGLIPAPPSAFNRLAVNWEQARKITTSASSLQLPRYLQNGSEPSIYEIPLNEDESFLLEYRGDRSVYLDSLQFELSRDRETTANYMEVLQTYLADRITVSDSSGVLLAVENYDWGLGGAGMLIWHIDRSVIREQAEGFINDDPAHRAVDLEEADGSQDIGQAYSILDAGFQSELGTPIDFWYKSNPSPVYKNEFSAGSTPNSNSYRRRAPTGVKIFDFGEAFGDRMTFSFEREYFETGFPRTLPPGPLAFTAGAIENAAGDHLFVLTDNGRLIVLSETDSVSWPLPVSPPVSLTLADRNENGFYDALIIVSGDSLFAYPLAAPLTSPAQPLFSPLALSGVSGLPVAGPDGLFIPAGRQLLKIAWDGQKEVIDYNIALRDATPGFTLPENSSDAFDFSRLFYDADGALREVRFDNRERRFFSVESGRVSFDIADSLDHGFATADVDGNGIVDIVFARDKELYAFQLNGVLLSGFPVSLAPDTDENFAGVPLLLQDKEKAVRIFAVSNKGVVYGYDASALPLEGFPLVAGGQVSQNARIVQWDDDAAAELVVVTDSGFVYGWELPASDDFKVLWNGVRGDAAHSALPLRPGAINSSPRFILDAKRVYNYPNPAKNNKTRIRYYLTQGAIVTIRIFDGSGFMVDEFVAPGSLNGYNEVEWQVGNVASGVYLCEVRAEAGGKTESKIIKILVVH
ncbi:MAG TPA: T9SS type A sorting domain-containing protein [Caldithrix abyssi]|uniref:T9SS type A sorting domain-containing protein n=1 Tax=Caldithrix abyssi TaxID=187145 RepID=A0A7V1LQ51_CALAY|nr:T9SS type A sorting domain-containing protein [Caldithrix abyssi]